MAVVQLLCLILASVTGTLLAEGISWLLIYRTRDYQLLKSTIDRNSKKLEKKKDVAINNNKKVNRIEETLKQQNRDLSLVKMKSMFAVMFTMITFMGLLGSWFDGVVVATLPFEPIRFIQGLSHRGLLGDNYLHCSYIFFYILCSMSVRSNVQKILGTAPPRTSGGGMFDPPSSS